jgi:hypothetical protein
MNVYAWNWNANVWSKLVSTERNLTFDTLIGYTVTAFVRAQLASMVENREYV